MSGLGARVKRWLSVPGSWALLQPVVRTFAFVLAPRHRVAVFVVPVDERGRVLLLRHVIHPKAPWGLAGGWLRRGERPADGARREFREETGLEVQLGPVARLGVEPEPTHLTLVYAAGALPGELRLGYEIADYGWFPGDGLPDGAPPFVHVAVRDVLRAVGTAPAP